MSSQDIESIDLVAEFALVTDSMVTMQCNVADELPYCHAMVTGTYDSHTITQC